ncbi:thiamine ABC transporter substrate-binding protein [Jannaschia rubra]|uniref:Thiamine-binding periplasmic protein n=1 Tax=Jannaschia rubra TaxID=282197 RepID=A0A0M6XQD2_9RHOB|nr:thiamine ABC transporter substrate binding subunit [Jannaschia rubra]CTQ32797.1 Thiamine-binding periplasmic protein precursor [Jannaschia rubra]SFF89660.1 thiamine transport system substrate-binding protein [Jannaschia rubra]
MRSTITIAAGLTLIGTAVAAEPLTVYAPDYFASEWGPGPAIKAAFEASCSCEIDYVTGDVLPRLRLEGERTRADVVIGLNTDDAERARATGLFAPHNVDTMGLTMPVDWEDDVFLPFNWGHTAFVYDTTRVDDVPDSFRDLVDNHPDLTLAIQDPRTSVSGLAMALWMHRVFGEEATDAWAALAPRIVTVTKGWSESYGMFTDGEVEMVLSYTTSPAYHLIAEDDDTKKAAIFPEGHYVMVETAGQLARTDQPDLAQAFMDFILSEEFQSIIPEGNWSLPAKLPPERMPEGFAALAMPEVALIYDSAEAEALRDTVIAEFEAGMAAR